MLKIHLDSRELFDDTEQKFIKIPEIDLEFEHSLVSIAEWESKWKRPFLQDGENKTIEETLDYIRCMCLNKNISSEILSYLGSENIKKLKSYIDDEMTAAKPVNKSNNNALGQPKKERITAEVIYYWMTALQIPFECQYWHISRLLALIRVCNEKSQPKKKEKPTANALQSQAEINRLRREMWHTTG